MVDFKAKVERDRAHRKAGHPGKSAERCEECRPVIDVNEGSGEMVEEEKGPEKTGAPPEPRPDDYDFSDEPEPLDPRYYDQDGDLLPLPRYSCIMGTAGTGKTFTARELASHYGAELLATTGIAAINIGGATINSCLGYYDTESMQDAYTAGWIQSKLRRNLEDGGVYDYIIDEVSMMDGRQLTVLVDSVDEVNESTLANSRRKLSITLIGDFCQLPPVKAPFAFQSARWEKFQDHITTLREIRRQSDREFIEALQAVRKGQGGTALEYFESRLERATDKEFDGPTIYAKNDEVDRFNKLRLSELKTPEITFESRRGGEKQAGEWKNVPAITELKEGALVMVLANLRTKLGYTYVNGDLGTLLSKETLQVPVLDEVTEETITVDRQFATVRLQRTGEVVRVSEVRREKKEPTGKKDPRFKVVGWIEYMPLRCAYATTCHKSQGLSLDKIQVNFANYFFGTPGMMYVALSRARTPEGLRLVGTAGLFRDRVKSDPKLKEWL